MGTNFRGWLNFVVFKGTSQTAKNNPGKIFVRLCPRKNTCHHWARQAWEWHSFVTFVQLLTIGKRETPHVVFLRYHLFTDPRVPSHNQSGKGRGNYTHNKSAKIKTFENLIIKMLQQNYKLLYQQKGHWIVTRNKQESKHTHTQKEVSPLTGPLSQ